MEWFIAVVAVAALGVAAIAAAGGMGQMSKEPVYDTYRQDLPDRPLTAADIETLRFGVTLRGYAMGQVDDLLERLGREIAERDGRLATQSEQLARLTGSTVDDPPTVEQPAVAQSTVAESEQPVVEQPAIAEAEPVAGAAPPATGFEDHAYVPASTDRDEPPR